MISRVTSRSAGSGPLRHAPLGLLAAVALLMLAACADTRSLQRAQQPEAPPAAPADIAALVAALPRPSNPPRAPYSDEITLVEVDKTQRRMTLWNHVVPVRQYDVALGAQPYGHKRMYGDQRTPEGRYTIDFANPNSAFHLSLRVSYPNAEDQAYAQERGFDPGGDIFIHGEGSRLRQGDWTDGCIAITNAEMTEVWQLVSVGTPIHIRP